MTKQWLLDNGLTLAVIAVTAFRWWYDRQESRLFNGEKINQDIRNLHGALSELESKEERHTRSLREDLNKHLADAQAWRGQQRDDISDSIRRAQQEVREHVDREISHVRELFGRAK